MAGSQNSALSSSTGGIEAAGSVVAHDVAVIGGGLAGLRAALAAAAAGADVAVVSKVHPMRSHSGAAQGGINAALRGDDSPEQHAFDTVKGSDYLADQEADMVMTADAPARVLEMEHWGCAFSRTEDGRIAQRPFGGAGFPRTAYAQDRTGHNLLHTLYETCVREDVRVYEELFATRLAVSGGRCVGLVALDLREGRLVGIQSRSVVIATGGYGQVFARSTNALINTGDGAAIAYRAGVPLEDMEFVQFHPTTLLGSNILMTEGARGEGGYLLNGQGERFMARYAAKAMELAPRDIVARAIQTETDGGRGVGGGQYVHLDLRHLGEARIVERLPGIREIAMHFAGVDPVKVPIPIQPGQHYSMGGVPTDVHGATDMPGLYAAGEAACVSVHGANRLGGNSLLDTLVFGKRAGEAAAAYAMAAPEVTEGDLRGPIEEEVDRVGEVLSRPAGGPRPVELRTAMQEAMFAHFGVFRDGATMESGLDKLRALRGRLDEVSVDYKGVTYNQALIVYLELDAMLELAEVVALGSLRREESRGSHARRDFPERDDEGFLRHTMAVRTSEGPALSYRPVGLGLFEVKERAY